MKLTKLTQTAVDRELAAMYTESETWARADAFQEARRKTYAELVLPNGELCNPAIAGFVWAWSAKRVIEHLKNGEATDRVITGLEAQGLEGFSRVRLPYNTALLVAQFLPRRRYLIFKGKGE